MIKYENQCCDCGQPCLGNSCSMVNVPVFICDYCKDEVDYEELYEYEGYQICKWCLLDQFKKVTI